MGDEYDMAEADYWSRSYDEDDSPQPRSFVNPRGLSRRAQRLEEAKQRLAMTPQISVKRGGIEFQSSPLDMYGIMYPVKKESSVRSTEDILAEATAMREEAERLERMAEEREKYGADPFKNGTVLKVDMKYRTGNRSYAYAVIKIAGKFYLSGKMGATTHDANGGMTWENFVAWLAQGDATVWQAGGLKQVL